ncbi:MAG TPA: serine hydrolase, partial [Candidatus Limnocylindrales bacterium]|nr:serine hydrolase [Candidatus Limnocylindrales bacterium]
EDRILLQGATRLTPKPWALPIAGHNASLDLAAYGTGGALPCLSVATFSFATSAIASDAPSLARWGWGLFSGTLLDRDSLMAMTTAEFGGYGLGIERLPDFSPNLAYGVHGGQVGYSAFLVILPERQAVAALFVNDADADVQAGARRLIRALGP